LSDEIKPSEKKFKNKIKNKINVHAFNYSLENFNQEKRRKK